MEVLALDAGFGKKKERLDAGVAGDPLVELFDEGFHGEGD